MGQGKPVNRTAAALIICIWLALAVLAAILAMRFLNG